MLTIPPEQLEAFARVEVQKFEEWMLAHLERFFPAQCGVAGEAQLRETIRAGIKRAAAYALVSRRDVCKYIDLIVVFGRDFDMDARFPWAGEILNQRRDPGFRIQALHEVARKHLPHA